MIDLSDEVGFPAEQTRVYVDKTRIGPVCKDQALRQKKLANGFDHRHGPNREHYLARHRHRMALRRARERLKKALAEP